GDEREDLLPRREAGDEVVELGEEVLEHGVSFLVVMAPASPRTAPRGRARCHRPGCASHGSPVTDVRRRGVTPSTGGPAGLRGLLLLMKQGFGTAACGA